MIATRVCRIDHLVDLLLRKVAAKHLAHFFEFFGAKRLLVVEVEDAKRLQYLVLLLGCFHGRSHHDHELIVVDRSIIIRIKLFQ